MNNLSVPEFMDGWRSPKNVQTIHQSDVGTIKTVLIAIPEYYDHPVLGYYIGAPINSWRMVGSPSDFTGKVVAWQPLPAMPFQEEK